MNGGAWSGIGQGIQQAFSPKNIAMQKAQRGQQLTPFEQQLIGYDPQDIANKKREQELRLDALEAGIKDKRRKDKAMKELQEGMQNNDWSMILKAASDYSPEMGLKFQEFKTKKDAEEKQRIKMETGKEILQGILQGVQQTQQVPVNLPQSRYLQQLQGMSYPQTTTRPMAGEEILKRGLSYELETGEPAPAGVKQLATERLKTKEAKEVSAPIKMREIDGLIDRGIPKEKAINMVYNEGNLTGDVREYKDIYGKTPTAIQLYDHISKKAKAGKTAKGELTEQELKAEYYKYNLKRRSGGTTITSGDFTFSTGGGQLPEITFEEWKQWYQTGVLPDRLSEKKEVLGISAGTTKPKEWKKWLK